MTTRHEQPLLPEEERNATVAVYDVSLAEDAERWARSDVLFGSFFFIPGDGHVAIGGTAAESVEVHVGDSEMVA